MSSQQDNAKLTQWSALRKKGAGPLRLSAIKKMEVNLTDDSNRLSDPVVITITCGNHTRTLVVHHPVGAHKLQRDDWVLTPIDEVETLLAFAEDPSKAKKDAARRELRLALAKDLGFYKEDKKVLYYTGKGADKLKDVDVAAPRRDAQKLYEEARREAHAEYLRECAEKNRKPKQDWAYGRNVAHFLNKEVKAYEDFITEQVEKDSKWKAGLAKIEPTPFETKSGPFQDRPQSAVCGSGKITATKEQMVDLVAKHLVNTMSGGFAFPLSPPKTVVDSYTAAVSDQARLDSVVSSILAKYTT